MSRLFSPITKGLTEVNPLDGTKNQILIPIWFISASGIDKINVVTWGKINLNMLFFYNIKIFINYIKHTMFTALFLPR